MKYLLTLVLVVGFVAVVTRLPSVRRALLVLLGLLAFYAVLKMTGVIEAIAPNRDGVY
ncbi:MAG TPA: hypothetical protein VM422_04810 [Amaricoccus sp.]|jgi:hypothetical protein|nr:hypothetical protein [Amaricoccus sp.]